MNVITEIEKQLPVDTDIPQSGVSEVASRASEELAFWQGLKESDSIARPRLAQMWAHSGWDETQWTPGGTPWSAVFVSYLLRGSGLEPNASHYRYVSSVMEGKSPGWKAYSIPKNLGHLRLSPGDVLVKPRGSGGAPGTDEHYRTHGDVIYRIDESNRALLAGGNVGDTAKQVGKIQLDADGKPTGSLHPYVVILKRKKKDSNRLMIGGGLLLLGILFSAWRLR